MNTQPKPFSAARWTFIAFVISLAAFLSFLCLHFFFVAFEPRFGFYGGLALALGGVLILDLGAWIWKMNITASESDSQEWISRAMGCADLGLALLAGGYHLMQLVGAAGLAPWMGQAVGVALVVALVINVAAVFAYQLCSPASQEARDERFAARLYRERLNEQKQKRILAAADTDAAYAAAVQTEAFRRRFLAAEGEDSQPVDADPIRLNSRIPAEATEENFTPTPAR